MIQRIKNWWYMRRGVRVPLWALSMLAEVHFKYLDDDGDYQLMMGATPEGWHHQRYVNAWLKIRECVLKERR